MTKTTQTATNKESSAGFAGITQRAANGGSDPSWLNLAFLGRPDFQSRGLQIHIFKGFWDLWTENRGAPKTPNSTTTDLTPRLCGPLSDSETTEMTKTTRIQGANHRFPEQRVLGNGRILFREYCLGDENSLSLTEFWGKLGEF